MQEINLLQNKLKDRSESWDRRNNLVSGVLIFLLIAVAGLGGMFLYMNQSTQSKLDAVKADNVSIKSRLDSRQGDLASAKDFQAQLGNIDQILDHHIYWSAIFDQFQASILKKAKYATLQAKTNGNVHVEGLTDTYEDLGKLVLSLSTNEHLHDVRLLSAQVSSGQDAGYTFSIDFKINQDMFSKE
jgi:Tfp pilus assembly protein PilN